MSPKFELRGPSPEDVNFILSTWLRGLFFGNDWLKKHVRAENFFGSFDEIVKLLLVRPSVSVQVCCLKEDPDVILGYSVSEDSCLHFVFVKEPWRKMGIAKALVPKGIKYCSCITDLGHKLKPKNWELSPFLLTGGVNGRKKTSDVRSW